MKQPSVCVCWGWSRSSCCWRTWPSLITSLTSTVSWPCWDDIRHLRHAWLMNSWVILILHRSSIMFTSLLISARTHNWKSPQVVNSHLVRDPTIRQPGFDLTRQQWSLLNHFHTEQGHCGACRRKRRLTDTDLCPCGKTQTMSHIVESCPRTKLIGGLSRLHSADEDAVSWLTSCGLWHAYEKKKKWVILTQQYFHTHLLRRGWCHSIVDSFVASSVNFEMWLVRENCNLFLFLWAVFKMWPHVGENCKFFISHL